MAKKQRAKESSQLATVAAPNPDGRWKRLALTFGALVVFFLARQIAVPGVDIEMLRRAGVTPERYSIVALGLTPFLSAALLVEIVVALVPRWRHLRHGGLVGRAELQRATTFLGLLFAFLQGYTTTQFLCSQAWQLYGGLSSLLLGMITLVGGAILCKFTADFVTSRGVVNGYGLFIGVSTFMDGALALWHQAALLTPIGIGAVVGRIGFVAFLTWFVLGKWQKAPIRTNLTHSTAEKPILEADEAIDNPYAAPKDATGPVQENQDTPGLIDLPNPAAGVVPNATAATIMAIPAVAASWNLPGLGSLAASVTNRVTMGVLSILLLFSLTFFLTWLFNQPRLVANVYSRMTSAPAARAHYEGAAREAIRHANLRGCFYLLALFVIDSIAKLTSLDSVSVTSWAFATAMILDFTKEMVFLGEHRDFIMVWPEHRPYAIAPATAALRAAGITCHVRDEFQRRMLQFGAPYIPIEILVPHEEAEQATKILQKVLLEKPIPSGETDRKIETAFVVSNRPLSGWLMAGLGALTFLAIPLSLPLDSIKKERHASNTKLEFVIVDDEHSIFDEVTDESSELKYGVQQQKEQVSVGPGKTVVNKYAVVEKNEGETHETARTRLEAWSKAIKTPNGTRAVISEYSHYDEDLGKVVVTGWRTYLLKDTAIITNADIADAKAMPNRDRGYQGWYVRLEFTESGAKRFEQVTGENIKRRFAIVLDGIVKSAPVIQSKIPGGVATITMGAGDEEKQKVEAQNLEKTLNGE